MCMRWSALPSDRGPRHAKRLRGLIHSTNVTLLSDYRREGTKSGFFFRPHDNLEPLAPHILKILNCRNDLNIPSMYCP